jgi:hypothetical protein
VAGKCLSLVVAGRMLLLACLHSPFSLLLSPFSFLSLTSHVPLLLFPVSVISHLLSLVSCLTSFVSRHLSSRLSFSDSSLRSVLSPVVFLLSSLASFYLPLIVIFVLAR